jgi:two-component system sensor histidine kinase/response regulator
VGTGSTGSTTLTILFADDVAESRVLVERIVARAGYRIDVAADGDEAILREAEKPFDIILLDLGMPRMDGFSAAKRIRARERAQQIPRRPIIAISAYDPGDLVERLDEAEIDAFMPKPIRPQSLLDLLGRYTPRARTETPTEIPANPLSTVPPDLLDIIPLFLESRDKDLVRIPELVSAAGFQELYRLGHNIKGTSAAFHLRALSDMGLELELAARNQDGAAVLVARDKLEPAIEALRAAAQARGLFELPPA